MGKISGYSENTTPSLNDFALGETASGPSTNRFKWLNILSLFNNSNDFGVWQDWTPTITGFSAVPAGGFYRYIQIGKTVTLVIYQGSDGTSNSTSFTISLPVTAATIPGMHWTDTCRIVDNTISVVGIWDVASGATTVGFGKDAAGNVFTASGGKRCIGAVITYEAA